MFTALVLAILKDSYYQLLEYWSLTYIHDMYVHIYIYIWGALESDMRGYIYIYAYIHTYIHTYMHLALRQRGAAPGEETLFPAARAQGDPPQIAQLVYSN